MIYACHFWLPIRAVPGVILNFNLRSDGVTFASDDDPALVTLLFLKSDTYCLYVCVSLPSSFTLRKSVVIWNHDFGRLYNLSCIQILCFRIPVRVDLRE
ncbi:hypothetical protein J2782_004069 [Brucella pseudogrignonensis]|uniref:Uncharacterized protein n=1 Tax=Brucella pseudogrignonensis TaxID=419475 RepID=A0ABU1ME40_9HYPH|nr:hypothetical protein [Brucella pseudogrignonensis]